jgi:hypothetical protein
MIAGLWPDTPLHAVATDRADTFALTTGFVAEDAEAVYYLDSLTGILRAAVLSNRTQGFQAMFETNIHADLASVIKLKSARGGTALQMPQNPNYMMVTGMNDIRRTPGQRRRPGLSALYVAEANTGIVLVYVVPWSSEMHSADQPLIDKLQLWAGEQFSSAVIRTQ